MLIASEWAAAGAWLTHPNASRVIQILSSTA